MPSGLCCIRQQLQAAGGWSASLPCWCWPQAHFGGYGWLCLPTSWPTLRRRYFETEPWQDIPQKWWFGGGTDITPSYVDAEDMKHFHGVYKVSWLTACVNGNSPDP